MLGPYIRLPVPVGGPYAMNAKASTQRNGFKVEVTSLKVGSSEAAGEALFRVDRQGHADGHRECRRDAPRRFGTQGAARHRRARRTRTGVCATAAAHPTLPFSASWLGRSSLSVTVRLGEVVGLGAKMQNASVTLVSAKRASPSVRPRPSAAARPVSIWSTTRPGAWDRPR